MSVLVVMSIPILDALGFLVLFLGGPGAGFAAARLNARLTAAGAPWHRVWLPGLLIIWWFWPVILLWLIGGITWRVTERLMGFRDQSWEMRVRRWAPPDPYLLARARALEDE